MKKDKFGKNISSRKDELARRIEFCEKSKREVERVSQDVLREHVSGEISQAEYYDEVRRRLSGKSAGEWIDYYDKYILQCNEELKKCNSSLYKNRLKSSGIKILYLLFAAVLIFSSVYFVSDSQGITGFSVFGNVSVNESVKGLNESLGLTGNAPEVFVVRESEYVRRVNLVSEGIDYKDFKVNIGVGSKIKLKDKSRLKVYLAREGKREPVDFEALDSDSDGLIDSLSWVSSNPQESEFIIVIVKAEHLDSSRRFISDIYEEVSELDGVWSEEISDGEFVRVVFERNLKENNDITVYPRIISGNPKIEVYETYGSDLIAIFDNLIEDSYNKVFLSGLVSERQDSFDLLILEGSVEFDHVIDPTESLWADSHITGGVSGSGSALGSTDGSWTSDIGNTNWNSRFSMENPSASISGTQTVNVLARKDSSGGNNPSVNSVDLYENGVFVATLVGSTSISSSTGQTLSGNFDASAISNPNNVEIFVDTSGVGGPPSSRRAVQIDSIEWVANLAEVDNEYPVFSNFLENPENNTVYGFGASHGFNTTIGSTNGTSWIRFDNVNFTASSLSGVFNVTIAGLSAGNHFYNWSSYGNGTGENFNMSETRHFFIAKTVPEGSISGTSSIDFGTAGDVEGTESNSGDGDVSYALYRDNVAVSNPDTTTLGAGTYNYIYNATSGANYTSNSSLDTFTLAVNQVASVINLTLGGNQSNKTLSAGSSLVLNASLITGDSSGRIVLYNNGTLINNNTIEASNDTTFSSEGLYNITAYYEGTQNYTLSSRTYSVNVTQAPNSPPLIIGVDSISAVDPTENGVTFVNFNFTATDTDGVSNLNDSTASAYFQKSGETTRSNTTCATSGSSFGNSQNYSCSIGMQYFDGSGSWTVNLTISDVNGEKSENSTTSFTYNLLTAMVLSPSSLEWATLFPGDTDKLSGSNPLTINNTGNDDVSDVRARAIDLFGEINSALTIPSANFTVHTSNVCDSGTSMVNGSAIQITGAVLNAGNHSANDGSTGQEQLYFCLEQVPLDLTSQAYSTPSGWPWEISLLLAALRVVGSRKKRGKKKLKELTEDNILGIVEEKFREKYGVDLKALLDKGKSKGHGEVLVPIGIFNSGLGVAEALCRYLKDKKGMKFSEISRITKRDQRTLWNSYRNAKRKEKEAVSESDSSVKVPASIFSDRNLSTLESLVYYLREEGFRNSEIAKSLGKDARNVWEVYQRAKNKLSRES